MLTRQYSTRIEGREVNYRRGGFGMGDSLEIIIKSVTIKTIRMLFAPISADLEGFCGTDRP